MQAGNKKQAKKEEKKFTLTYTEGEVIRRIRQLEQSENLQLYLKVQEGAQDYDELKSLSEVVSEEQNEIKKEPTDELEEMPD